MGQRNIKLCQTRGVTFKNLKVNEDRLIATTRWRTRKRGSSHPPLPLLHLRWEGAFPSQRAPFQGFKDHSNPSPPTTSIFIQLLPVGQRSLVGCSPWGREESDTTERLHFHFSLSCTGEGNGNPLQCSWLENPRDRGAWWAAVYGVTQSWTRMKRLSSSWT